MASTNEPPNRDWNRLGRLLGLQRCQAHRHILVAAGSFLVMTYLSSLLLIYLKMFLSGRTELSRLHYGLLQFLCMASGAALIATNSVLLVLVDKECGLFSLNLLPVQAIVVMLACCAGPSADSVRDKAFEEEVKSSCKVAVFVAAAGYAVQTPVVFGNLKNSSFKEQRQRLDLSVSFLASALGVFSAVATCMPLGFQTAAGREKVLAIVRHLKCAVLLALAVTAVTLGQEFIGGNVVLSLLPEITAAAVYCGSELLGNANAAGERAVDRRMELLPVSVVGTFGFGMLGTAYATFHGTEAYDSYMRALMFSLVAALISSLVRVVRLRSNSQRENKSLGAWVGFVWNILPLVVMFVACPLAAKVVIDFFAVS